MSSIQIRPATLRDAKAIAQIQVSSAQDAYKAFWPDTALNGLSVAQRQAYWREAINMCEPQVLVAHLDNEVMGFVGFDRSRDKGTPSTTGEIWAMYAAPSHWEKGVGQALVEWIGLGVIAGAFAFRTAARPDNGAAIEEGVGDIDRLVN